MSVHPARALIGWRTSSGSRHMSRPGHREAFYSLFWLDQGVTRVGFLCSFFYVFVFLCFWPGMVLNQGQLSVVVSD
jgi:hypothetical protein